MLDQCSAESSVGSLIRQPTLREGDGLPFRLDERFGRSFAVVGRTPADLAVSSNARAILERLGASFTSLEGLDLVEGEHDNLFDTHPAVVVRPDRYIFGVVDDAWTLDQLAIELSKRVALGVTPR